MIVGEFGKGNMLCPGSRVRATEGPKISFYFLVDTFSFSISLGVVGGGEGEFITEEFAQFFGKGGGELCYSSFSPSFCLTVLSYSMSTYLER